METRNRPKTSVFVGVTLDGFMARRDGSIDFLEPYEGLDHGFNAFFETVDALLIGRNTYEFVLQMLSKGMPWPYQGRRLLVMTHRPLEAAHGERATTVEPEEALALLAAEGVRHVYVDGGVVIRSFLARNLVDHLVVSFVPELIGEGMPIFGGVRLEQAFTLESATPFPNGLAQLRYRRKNELAHS